MLVLTRKTHEKIQIGPNITVTILRVKGGTVRIGVDAPTNVAILRNELVVRDAAASREADRRCRGVGGESNATDSADSNKTTGDDTTEPTGASAATWMSLPPSKSTLNEYIQRRRVPSVDSTTTMPHQEHSGTASPHFDAPIAIDLTTLLIG